MPIATRPNFRLYLIMSIDELLEKYADVTTDLYGIEQEYHLSLATEANVRYGEYFNHDFNSTTHQFRDVAAKRAAVAATMSVHEADGDRKSLLHEKTFIELVLKVKHNVN